MSSTETNYALIALRRRGLAVSGTNGVASDGDALGVGR